MPGRVGFWSYVHADDSAEGGRIRQLANDLREQYALISGESIEIFVDQDALTWGDDWRERIDTSLASILFFIPVISPRYFLSSECRRELQEFARSAARLGVRELVLPLVYINVPALTEESPIDEAVALVKTYQWVDWRDLRFEDVTSSAYRRAVASLAQRLVDANQRILEEESPDPVNGAESDAPTADDEPGVLDILSAGEAAFPKIVETLTDIGSEIQEIGAIAERATQDLLRADQQGKGFAGRLTISRRLAQELSGPADHVFELANTFTTSLYDADIAIRTLIARGPNDVIDAPENRPNWDEFSENISSLANISVDSMANIQGFVDSIAPVESMSRDLRPPLQKLRRGLTSLTEGTSLITEWNRLTGEATAQLNQALQISEQESL